MKKIITIFKFRYCKKRFEFYREKVIKTLYEISENSERIENDESGIDDPHHYPSKLGYKFEKYSRLESKYFKKMRKAERTLNRNACNGKGGEL